ncbi:hypothetical protein [Chitinophaga pinensis]|uniref:hypothetical protein n=1 Tax=Chitinophaga pinensis TaxID=79329 RepID=UPI001C995FF9|nr:hypothetical protein [Chitinophaga pinensis]
MAGTGNSPAVQYSGTGAYFLDKIAAGNWRLEVMPDVIPLGDPFEKASLSKEVRRVQWNDQAISIHLPDLGEAFSITPVNAGNHQQPQVTGTSCILSPGTYLLTRKGSVTVTANSRINGVIALKEFAAPQPVRTTLAVYHQPLTEVSAGQPATITATIAGIDGNARVWLEGNRFGGQWFKADMHPTGAGNYAAILAPEILQPGLLQYRLIIQQGDHYTSFPGRHEGDPYAWDNYQKDTWQTFIAAPNAMLSLLNVADNKDLITIPAYTQGAYTAGSSSGQLAIRIAGHGKGTDTITGVSRAVAASIKDRVSGLKAYNTIVIRARVQGVSAAQASIALITADASAFATVFPLKDTYSDIEVPLSSLSADRALLLPRPYPGFMPLWFKAAQQTAFDISQLDKIELTNVPAADTTPYTIEVESVWLKVK